MGVLRSCKFAPTTGFWDPKRGYIDSEALCSQGASFPGGRSDGAKRKHSFGAGNQGKGKRQINGLQGYKLGLSHLSLVGEELNTYRLGEVEARDSKPKARTESLHFFLENPEHKASLARSPATV